MKSVNYEELIDRAFGNYMNKIFDNFVVNLLPVEGDSPDTRQSGAVGKLRVALETGELAYRLMREEVKD